MVKTYDILFFRKFNNNSLKLFRKCPIRLVSLVFVRSQPVEKKDWDFNKFYVIWQHFSKVIYSVITSLSDILKNKTPTCNCKYHNAMSAYHDYYSA